MKIRIIAVGKWKSATEREIFNDYMGRIRWNVELKEVEEKRKLPAEKLKEAETELLLKAAGNSKIILLDEKGKHYSTREFAGLIEKVGEQTSDGIAFLIGGADGHSEAIKKRADYIISLGNMTWPHLLVRCMLAEQLYRVWSIKNNHPYHRD